MLIRIIDYVLRAGCHKFFSPSQITNLFKERSRVYVRANKSTCTDEFNFINFVCTVIITIRLCNSTSNSFCEAPAYSTAQVISAEFTWWMTLFDITAIYIAFALQAITDKALFFNMRRRFHFWWFLFLIGMHKDDYICCLSEVDCSCITLDYHYCVL